MRKLTAGALVATALLATLGTGASGAQATTRNVLILGTSTTEGMGATPANQRYASLVAAARPTDTVTVVGRGGTTLADPNTPNWLTYTVPTGFDVVVLQFGFNEWNRGMPAATFQQHLLDFATRVRTANPGAKLIVLSTWISQYPAVNGWDARAALWQEYGQAVSAALRAIGGNTAHVDVDPTGSKRLAAPFAWKAPGTPGYDGLHYNNAGHAELARQLLTAL